MLNQIMSFVVGKHNTVTINGIDVTNDFINSSDEIIVTVGSKTYSFNGKVEISVTGDCGNITTSSGNVNVAGTAKNITSTTGDVNCSDIIGSVTTQSGNIRCGNIGGKVETVTGNVKCNGDIGGSVKTTTGNISR